MTEHCVVRAKAEVAGERQFAAAAQSVSADSRDHRDWEIADPAHDRIAEAAQFLRFTAAQLLHLPDIRTGSKGKPSCAPEDQATDLFKINLVKRRIKIRQHLSVDRIERFLTVNDQIGDRTSRFILHKRHCGPSLFSVRDLIDIQSLQPKAKDHVKKGKRISRLSSPAYARQSRSFGSDLSTTGSHTDVAFSQSCTGSERNNSQQPPPCCYQVSVLFVVVLYHIIYAAARFFHVPE